VTVIGFRLKLRSVRTAFRLVVSPGRITTPSTVSMLQPARVNRTV